MVIFVIAHGYPLLLAVLSKIVNQKSLDHKKDNKASLVAQWLRIGLPKQGTRVPSLVWEDPTHRGATKPVHHNY